MKSKIFKDEIKVLGNCFKKNLIYIASIFAFIKIVKKIFVILYQTLNIEWSDCRDRL